MSKAMIVGIRVSLVLMLLLAMGMFYVPVKAAVVVDIALDSNVGLTGIQNAYEVTQPQTAGAQSFAVDVYVECNTQEINAAAVYIKYDKVRLDAVAVGAGNLQSKVYRTRSVEGGSGVTTLAGGVIAGGAILEGNNYTIQTGDTLGLDTIYHGLFTGTVGASAWVLTDGAAQDDTTATNARIWFPAASVAHGTTTLGGVNITDGTSLAGRSYALQTGDQLGIGTTFVARILGKVQNADWSLTNISGATVAFYDALESQLTAFTIDATTYTHGLVKFTSTNKTSTTGPTKTFLVATIEFSTKVQLPSGGVVLSYSDIIGDGGITDVTFGAGTVLDEKKTATITQNPGVIIEITNLTTPSVAGTAQNLVLTVKEGGAVKANYTGTVHFTSTDAAALLPGDYTFTVGDAGVHPFTGGVTFKTVAGGAKTVTATDTVNAGITGTSNAVTVSPAAANKLAFGTAPATPVVAGATWTAFTVQILDTYNNLTTSTANVAIAPSTGTFAAGTTPKAAVGGVATFDDVKYNTAGTITVTASSTGLTSATSGNVVVGPAAANKLVFGTAPSTPVGAGATWTAFTVQILDTYNNLTTSTADVAVTTSGGAFSSGTTTKAAVGGVANFNDLTYNTIGTITVNATSAGLTGATSGNVVVSAGIANKLAFGTTPATPVTAGATWTAFTVQILDALNNLTTSTATVAVTTSGGAFSSGTVSKAAVAGVATFNDLKYNTASTVTVTASSTGLTPVTSGNVVVGPATAATLTVSGITDPITKNVASGVTVTAKDAFGNTATGYTGTIRFTSSDASATLPANYTFVGGDNGTKTFAGGVTMQTYGEQTVTATDTVTAITGTQTAITVIPVVKDTYNVATGWNIFSVPFSLEDGYRSWGEVVNVSAATLAGKVSIAYYYDPTSTTSPWKQVTTTYDLYPCDAIYIKMTGADAISLVADSLPSVPSKRLYAGWNLVGLGYYNANWAGSTKAVNEALTSIYKVTGDLVGYAQVVGPALNQTALTYLRDGGAGANMVAGDGYWVFMVNPGTLAGFTTTPLP